MPGIRHLVSVDDLSLAEIRELFEQARRFAKDLRASSDVCKGLISASLFYEPSTRTRLSFESAMLRLGGGVLTAADMDTSSASKGESLGDTVRVVSGAYADVIVLRHASEGAARLATEYSAVPVINAGDGSHEHPTQTLCDLYTLWIEKGGIEGLDVVLAGDLRYSRTIHSFVYALARFGANIVSVPHRGLELPDYVLRRLREEYGAEPVRADATELGDLASESDVVYLTPQKPHQLSLFTSSTGMRLDHIDAVYMTRPQTERFRDKDDLTRYVRLGQSSMEAGPLREAVVMHPLPRRDEIASELDDDPRSIYFAQAARGVPIRMAILAALLGRIELDARPIESRGGFVPVEHGQNPCPNPTCISRTEHRHGRSAFRLTSRDPLRAACGYCSQEIPLRLVGCSTTRRYHASDSAPARRIRPDHLVFFRDRAQAEAMGFSASAR
jgi:aspartate carbamoyltransferase catalytic subunit